MFDSLDDQIKLDDKKTISATERYVRWAAVAITSALVFGGLYYGVKLME